MSQVKKLRRQSEKKYKGRPCICWLCGFIGICSLIIIVILIVLVSTFYLPSITMDKLEGGTPPYSIESSGTNVQDMTVNMNWNLNFIVDNPNFYGLTVDDVSLNIYYRPTNILISKVNNTRIEVGPKTKTTLTFLVSVILKLNSENAATYLEIMNKCGYLGNKKTTLPLRYEVKINTRPINYILIPLLKINYDNGI